MDAADVYNSSPHDALSDGTTAILTPTESILRETAPIQLGFAGECGQHGESHSVKVLRAVKEKHATNERLCGEVEEKLFGKLGEQ